jgi:hypothetical protein
MAIILQAFGVDRFNREWVGLYYPLKCFDVKLVPRNVGGNKKWVQ